MTTSETSVAAYLQTVDDPSLTTLDAFHDALLAFQRVASTFGARLALELSELDAAHADEATRRLALDPVERGRGEQAALFGALDNATSRTKFIQDRAAQVNGLLTKLRMGVNDLRESQATLRALPRAPAPTP